MEVKVRHRDKAGSGGREIIHVIDTRWYAQYWNMISCGARLTAEVLPNSEVSLCVEHSVHGKFDSRIIADGTDVTVALEELLCTFCAKKLASWVRSKAEEVAGE